MYLRKVGAGAVRECQFTVYGFLSTADDLFGPESADDAPMTVSAGNPFCSSGMISARRATDSFGTTAGRL